VPSDRRRLPAIPVPAIPVPAIPVPAIPVPAIPVPSTAVPTIAATILAALLAGCPDEKPAGPPPSRFDAVTAKPAARPNRFCEKTWPAEGDGARMWRPPELRTLEGAPAPAPAPTPTPKKGWRWVNAWATWCVPCVEEMGLLARWREGFRQDGVEVTFELLSVDSPEAEPELKKWLTRGLPGAVSWVKSPDDFPRWLETSLGLDPDSAIPIHVLVDPAGRLRCARVGAVHAQDYGAVRALLTGG